MSVKNICLPVNEEFEIVANSDFFFDGGNNVKVSALGWSTVYQFKLRMKAWKIAKELEDHGGIVDYFITYYLYFISNT